MNRSLLHFSAEVRKHFAFLEELGFRCVSSEATLVRYESPVMAVCIYHGRQSYEIGLEIESVQVPIDSYSYSEVLRLLGAERADNYRNFATHTLEGVVDGVRELARVFHECIDASVLNNKHLFPQLKRQRESLSKAYAIKVQLSLAHENLESAWANKNYCKVVEILSPLQEQLTSADLKKLEYAKNHL